MTIPFDRRSSLERLGAEPLDVLVIGGGITGCGVALAAAAQGLQTGLVEAKDFASGTSSRSSKLVHGGLRYLQQHDYRLVYEALHERQRLIANAPHLVHPLPFLVPLFGKGGVMASSVARAYSLALWTYDVTGGVRIGHRHRRLAAGEALAHFPALRADRLVASFLYWDAQTDDARLTLALARTAAAHGAALANYSPVGELVEEAGVLRGAILADGTRVSARAIVNASGVWAGKVASMAGGQAADPVQIRPAKGVHVTVPAERLPCDFAAVLAVPGDRRSVFVVPWPDRGGEPGYTYIGTTDTDYEGPLEDPRCTYDDVEYLLRAVNAWTSAGLAPEDVTGVWAGLRPLVSGARSTRTADLSRRHRVTVARNGLVSVTGGKLTTYRLMAADALAAVLDVLGSDVRRRDLTRRLPLAGAGPVPEGADSHLADRYGSEAGKLISLCQSDPSLSRPISPRLPYLRAEVVYAARHEMACTLDDVLSRRTRARILDAGAASEAAPDVATLLAAELGWDEPEKAEQLDRFLESVKADRAALEPLAPPRQGASA